MGMWSAWRGGRVVEVVVQAKPPPVTEWRRRWRRIWLRTKVGEGLLFEDDGGRKV